MLQRVPEGEAVITIELININVCIVYGCDKIIVLSSCQFEAPPTG